MVLVNVWYKLVYDNENTERRVLNIKTGTRAGEVRVGLGAESLCLEGLRSNTLQDDEPINGRRGLEAFFDHSLEEGEFSERVGYYNSQR